MTTAEAGEYLGCTRATLRTYIAQGLKRYDLSSRKVFYKLVDLQAFADEKHRQRMMDQPIPRWVEKLSEEQRDAWIERRNTPTR